MAKRYVYILYDDLDNRVGMFNTLKEARARAKRTKLRIEHFFKNKPGPFKIIKIHVGKYGVFGA